MITPATKKTMIKKMDHLIYETIYGLCSNFIKDIRKKYTGKFISDEIANLSNYINARTHRLERKLYLIAEKQRQSQSNENAPFGIESGRNLGDWEKELKKIDIDHRSIAQYVESVGASFFPTEFGIQTYVFIDFVKSYGYTHLYSTPLYTPCEIDTLDVHVNRAMSFVESSVEKICIINKFFYRLKIENINNTFLIFSDAIGITSPFKLTNNFSNIEQNETENFQQGHLPPLHQIYILCKETLKPNCMELVNILLDILYTSKCIEYSKNQPYSLISIPKFNVCPTSSQILEIPIDKFHLKRLMDQQCKLKTIFMAQDTVSDNTTTREKFEYWFVENNKIPDTFLVSKITKCNTVYINNTDYNLQNKMEMLSCDFVTLLNKSKELYTYEIQLNNCAMQQMNNLISFPGKCYTLMDLSEINNDCENVAGSIYYFLLFNTTVITKKSNIFPSKKYTKTGLYKLAKQKTIDLKAFEKILTSAILKGAKPVHHDEVKLVHNMKQKILFTSQKNIEIVQLNFETISFIIFTNSISQMGANEFSLKDIILEFFSQIDPLDYLNDTIIENFEIILDILKETDISSILL